MSYILAGQQRQLHELVEIERKPTSALLNVDLIQPDAASSSG